MLWRWRQHRPLKSWYTTTTLHDVTTQKLEAAMHLWKVGILPQHNIMSQARRWRQHGPLKSWYTTTTLHNVTAQKMEAAMDLWNFSILTHHYMASEHRKPRPEPSPPWKPQISQPSYNSPVSPQCSYFLPSTFNTCSSFTAKDNIWHSYYQKI